MVSPITREEYQEWLSLEVTKRLFLRISQDVEQMKTLAMNISEEDLKNLQGRYAVAANLLNLEYEDLYE